MKARADKVDVDNSPYLRAGYLEAASEIAESHCLKQIYLRLAAALVLHLYTLLSPSPNYPLSRVARCLTGVWTSTNAIP